VVHSYWRIQQPGEFRNNVARGAVISYEDIPADALTFAVKVAGLCRFDEVGLDICQAHGEDYVIEANMVYGLAGFRQIGLDIYQVLARMEAEGII
jgi:ribosomal protein S6--L-glutamate ligase